MAMDESLDSDLKSNHSDKIALDDDKDVAAASLDADIEMQRDAEKELQSTPDLHDEERDPNIVEFDGPQDPDNPKNWSNRRKMGITASMGGLTFTVTFSSSIFAVCLGPVSEEYGVSTVVAALGVCLFLLVSSTFLTNGITRV